MIDRQEILDFSRELGLSTEVLEKDYALGWLLAGIYNHADLKSAWLFKGGTCLKKCFFETYRFSEDLDFTIKASDQINEEFLRGAFQSVATWVYENSGVEIPPETISFEVYVNPRGKKAVQGKVGYRGPLQRRGSVPRIKLDLTDDERVVLDPEQREVHHPYSDKPDAGIQALCYCYEELFAEKMRALAERLRPRDLYDVIHFFRHDEIPCDRALVVRTLKEKCSFKGIAVPTVAALQARPERNELEAEWGNMLAHQLPLLPPFAHFFAELPKVFDWLFGVVAKAVTPAYPAGADIDTSWRPPATAVTWGMQAPLEIIRFAAANHLCVDLAYEGSRRLIEPYSLRRTKDGNIVLHAVRHQDGQPRSYRIDKIQGAQATETSFVPRYMIELTATGSLSIPPTANRSVGIFSAGVSTPRRRSAFGASFTGPKYFVECTICGKRFTRQSYDTRLNAHKDKSGYDCYGRVGFLVDTKY